MNGTNTRTYKIDTYGNPRMICSSMAGVSFDGTSYFPNASTTKMTNVNSIDYDPDKSTFPAKYNGIK